jgi:aminobenzoyl-glutamate transport protein
MSAQGSPDRRGLLDLVERIGNRLPEPAMLFVFGALFVMALSQAAVWLDWSVRPMRLAPAMMEQVDASGRPVLDPQTGQRLLTARVDDAGRPVYELVDNPAVNGGKPFRARSLLAGDGLYWALSSMVDNFVRFPPLGVVLVAMLGVGIAERTGFIGALLKAFMLAVPRGLLTPAVVFLGVNSSLATDAGYIVLPPVAAALYKAAGRSPLAGIAAVFAGIAGGFNANLLVTSLDPLLAGLTGPAAQTIDPAYAVNPACNWWFMIASTFMLTLVGWFVSSVLVEPRLSRKGADEGGPTGAGPGEGRAAEMTRAEVRAMLWGVGAAVALTGVFIAMAKVPGGALNDGLGKLPDAVRGPGLGDHFDRWAESIVPMIFFLFLVPGLVYGRIVGTLHTGKDFSRLLVETMGAMAPVIVLAFFAAQFISYFSFSNLDKMLAYTGGEMLARADLGRGPLLVAFIVVAMLFNLLIASMSAKYAVFAPIFVPMLMLVGISPELTQAAYRIGDSVTNVVSPLNAYLVIILVVMNQHAPRAGMGSLLAMMLPYSLVFWAVWTVMLLLWIQMDIPLGPGGPLEYIPAES